ncbi:biotin/lipoyl-containing protein, partial [Actinomyces denticolens]|uniref:biotin/lipoyl-containing protein n=1 Tax=Actinomyces denticolens TaxID=52767 RepID=UPI00273B68CE
MTADPPGPAPHEGPAENSQGKSPLMSESVKMPALGESVTEGTVSSWLKAVGDTVTADEPLV